MVTLRPHDGPSRRAHSARSTPRTRRRDGHSSDLTTAPLDELIPLGRHSETGVVMVTLQTSRWPLSTSSFRSIDTPKPASRWSPSDLTTAPLDELIPLGRHSVPGVAMVTPLTSRRPLSTSSFRSVDTPKPASRWSLLRPHDG